MAENTSIFDCMWLEWTLCGAHSKVWDEPHFNLCQAFGILYNICHKINAFIQIICLKCYMLYLFKSLFKDDNFLQCHMNSWNDKFPLSIKYRHFHIYKQTITTALETSLKSHICFKVKVASSTLGSLFAKLYDKCRLGADVFLCFSDFLGASVACWWLEWG